MPPLIAQKTEAAQAAARQEQVSVKSETQKALDKAAEANMMTGEMHKTQEDFAKATLKNAAEQTAKVQKEVEDATRVIDAETKAEPVL